jgi:mannan endo-1,4-beta-mannosidase
VTSRARAVVTAVATVVAMVGAGATALASIQHYHDEVVASALSAQRQAADHERAVTSSSPHPVPAVVHASLPSTGFSYLGVYDGSDTTPGQYAQVEQFAQAVGGQPNIVMYYSSWGEPFSISYAQTARQHGATLLIDIDPTSTSCADIAAGQDDSFLQSYAESVKAFGQPVIISFGHEMNGTWYSWGWTNTQPAAFVQAWRHIVDVFRQAGADNVTWLWSINAVASYEGPLADYWPGAGYVTWVGLDAYYYNPGDDFSSVFGSSIAAIRQVTDKPILVAETAIGQVTGQAATIPGLFAGVSTTGLLGFVWYDQAQDYGIYHQDWQLEGNPAAVAAFRAALDTYLPQQAIGFGLNSRRPRAD